MGTLGKWDGGWREVAWEVAAEMVDDVHGRTEARTRGYDSSVSVATSANGHCV